MRETPKDVSAWSPPSDPGKLYGRRSVPTSAPSFQSVCKILDMDSPAIVLLKLSQSFWFPDGEGVVVPIPGEVPDPDVRHAVVGVAHGVVDGSPAILIRNSWGLGWGLSGHAWLLEEFVAPRIFASAAL